VHFENINLELAPGAKSKDAVALCAERTFLGGGVRSGGVRQLCGAQVPRARHGGSPEVSGGKQTEDEKQGGVGKT
jgi:hypothetical protein